MPAVVVDHAAQVAIGVLPPCVRAFGKRNGAFADVAPERADADQRQFTDGAILYQLARLDDWRVVQEVFRGPVERGRAAGGLCHAAYVLDRAGGRFLAGDVLARLEAGDGLVRVQEGRRQEFHGVDAVVGQDVVVAGVYARRYSPLSGAKLGALRRRVAQRGDLAPLVRQVAGRVELRNRSTPDYGEAYFVHGRDTPIRVSGTGQALVPAPGFPLSRE